MKFVLPVYREDAWSADAVGSEFPYMASAVVFQVLVYLWEVFVELLQQRELRNPQFPHRLAELLHSHKLAVATSISAEPVSEDDVATAVPNASLDQFHKSRLYGIDKSKFAVVKATTNVVVSIASMCLGFYPLVWKYSAHIVASMGLDPFDQVYRTLAFVTLVVARDAVFSVALSLWSTFVIEERHGFNNETLRSFMVDFVKGVTLFFVIGYPLIVIIMNVVVWAGDLFYVYVVVVSAVISFGLMTVFPLVILPLLIKVTPLPHGSLRTKIEQLAAGFEFPVANISVCDTSTRSGHTNAQILGKSIFIDDTTLAAISEDQVVAVLAHELGHYKRWHLTRAIAMKQVYDFARLWAFARCLHDDALFSSFGFAISSPSTVSPIAVGYVLFTMAVWRPVEWLNTFVGKLHARFIEFDADAFAVDHGYSDLLQSALIQLSMENLVHLRTNRFYSAYHNSHPTLVERLDAMITRGKKQQ